ncbi:MAG: outer membrane lipoprotein-sorting protein [Gemmatimonadota bacterium]
MVCAGAFTVGAIAALASPLSGQEPREIVDRVDQLLRGESSRGVVEMEVVSSHWERTRTMRIWSLGTEYALIRIVSPKKDAGTATLKAGDEIWNYLPRVDRAIKIPTSLMSSSWMGSHFTNDDLVKEHRLIDDYAIETSYEGLRGTIAVWELDLTPLPEAPVIWERILYQVRKRDFMPVWAKFYDERNALVRTLHWSEYRTMGGRLVPTILTVIPADQPEERTEIRYLELEFDVGLEESFFSLRFLREQAD